MSRVVIDMNLCRGHGQCAMMAADVFDLDDDGYAVALVDEVTGELRRDTETAVQACPKQAISLQE